MDLVMTCRHDPPDRKRLGKPLQPPDFLFLKVRATFAPDVIMCIYIYIVYVTCLHKTSAIWNL